MSKEVIASPLAPAAIGPYSQAIRGIQYNISLLYQTYFTIIYLINQANGMIYCSGCLGVDPELKALVPGGVAAQARQVLTNMKNILEAGGSSMSKVVKCTVLLASMDYFAEVNGVYAEFFPENPPARATFAVAGLPLGGLVEIESIALA